MEHTFMTIHNLAPEATILFVSDSVTDILGYRPHEVQGRSCFDFFHPEEVPFARSVHSRGVVLDKAAVLHYARLISRNGDWISCECCFTVVHDVLVACTSIYRRDQKSERRAIEAPQIRRLFSSSSRDPRYHMLEHLSPKFKTSPPQEREPRAALILNRFTRTLAIMFSTNAVSSILGISAADLQNKSFYEYIAPNCLPDAIRCIESAKANDSIAYLRFWLRDPRRDEDFGPRNGDATNARETSVASSASDDSEGGAPVNDLDVDMTIASNGNGAFQQPGMHHDNSQGPSRRRRLPTVELEAVISCTSDGLVVILRKARPAIPSPAQHPTAVHPMSYQNGLFAAPWGAQPTQPYFPPHTMHELRPPLAPQHMPLQPHVQAAGGPPMDQLMQSIRDVAVFAWALVGINSNLTAYSRGTPRGEAQPLTYAHGTYEGGSQSHGGAGSSNWSSEFETSDDAAFTASSWPGYSEVSSMTSQSQHPSAMGSYEASPYVSDDGTTGAYGIGRSTNYHAGPRGLQRSHGGDAMQIDGRPTDLDDNARRPRSEWSQQSMPSSATAYPEHQTTGAAGWQQVSSSGGSMAPPQAPSHGTSGTRATTQQMQAAPEQQPHYPANTWQQ